VSPVISVSPCPSLLFPQISSSSERVCPSGSSLQWRWWAHDRWFCVRVWRQRDVTSSSSFYPARTFLAVISSSSWGRRCRSNRLLVSSEGTATPDPDPYSWHLPSWPDTAAVRVWQCTVVRLPEKLACIMNNSGSIPDICCCAHSPTLWNS